MIFRQNSHTVKLKVSVVEWQHQNEANIHRPAEEFTDDRSVSTSGGSAIAHWKDKPGECLENAAIYAVANLCQLILTIEFVEYKRSEGRSVSNKLL